MISQLTVGERIVLTAFDPEKDSETISAWTHDLDYLRNLRGRHVRPLAPSQVKKRLEDAEKEVEESGAQTHFAIRIRGDERLIGELRFEWVGWAHGTSGIQLGIAPPELRSQGYGSEALRLALRYAFHEMNLFHLRAILPAYNTGALRFFERAGFVEEVRQRERIRRDGQYFDLLWLGLTRDEWQARQSTPQGG